MEALVYIAIAAVALGAVVWLVALAVAAKLSPKFDLINSGYAVRRTRGPRR